MTKAALRFYHLTKSPPARAIGALCEKCLEQKWRVSVICQDQEALAMLDEALWLGPEDRFLPHGLAGGPHDARQPVLLGDDCASGADREALIALLPAAISPEDAAGRQRLFVLFNGADPDHLDAARHLWVATRNAGQGAEYYSEASGNWVLERRLEAYSGD